MGNIRHVISANGRSRFIPQIVDAIKIQRQALESGRQISVEFDEEKPGYPGDFQIEINRDKEVFIVDFDNTDPTRFPARIKAAARALYEEGFEGKFQISHEAGTMKIMQSR